MDPSLSNSTPMDLLNVTEYSSPCNSMPMNLLSVRDRLRLEQEERATARLQHWRQREQEWRQSEQTEVRQLEQHIELSIGVELDSEGPIVSTCMEHLACEFWRCYITHQWYNIPVSACSGSPPQCSTFSSKWAIIINETWMTNHTGCHRGPQ